jgi:hypothetical protein
MHMDDEEQLIPIPVAAEKYGVDIRKLRGAVWHDNVKGRLDLPMGVSSQDMVIDNDRLRDWAAYQNRGS